MSNYEDDNEHEDEEFDFNEFQESDSNEFNEDENMEFEQIEAEFRGTIPLEMISKWKETELNLRVNELNLAVLKTAVQVASQSWFWRFRSGNSKAKAIIQIYYSMNNLIDNNSSIYSDGP